MKKKAAGLITAGIVFGASASCLAGSNPYADVPKTDWSYAAVEQLVDQGLVSSCANDEEFRHLKRLTRYDLAVFVAQAMTAQDKADEPTKALMNRLIRSYSHELHIIGVEDDSVPEDTAEQNQPKKTEIEQKLNRLTLNGWGRIRYDATTAKGNGTMATSSVDNGTAKSGNVSKAYVNVGLVYDYKLNDRWTFEGETQFSKGLSESKSEYFSEMEKMVLKGNYKGVDVQMGRYDPAQQLSFAFDERINGVSLQWGQRWKSTLDWGRVVTVKDADTGSGYGSSANFWDPQRWIVPNDADGKEWNGTDVNGHTRSYYTYVAPLVYSYRLQGMVGHNTYAGFGLYHFSRGNSYQCQDQGKEANLVTAMVSSKLSPKVDLYAAYTHSSAAALDHPFIANYKSTKRNAYMLRMSYGHANLNQPHSWSLFALYRCSPMLASFSNADDWWINQEGWRFGGDYVLEKNLLFNTSYTWGRDVDNHNQDNTMRVQLSWIF